MRPRTAALFLPNAVSLDACSQISLKHGMKQLGALGQPGVGMVSNVLRSTFTPYVLLGLALYAVSSCFWLVLLSSWNLSYAYPMIAISYVLVVLLSRIFYREHVMPVQWLEIAFTCTCRVLVARFGSST